MEHQPRALTDSEAEELEQLCIASDTRELSHEEQMRCYELQGFNREDAEWLTSAGGRPISRITRADGDEGK